MIQQEAYTSQAHLVAKVEMTEQEIPRQQSSLYHKFLAALSQCTGGGKWDGAKGEGLAWVRVSFC